MHRALRAPLLAALLLLPGGARAESVAGLCPDGSAFVVQSRADIPCARAKLVEPSELPPLRPELLPHPWAWAVDREARNPRNPYNLIDAAQQIRALRAGEVTPAKSPPPPQAQSAPEPTPRVQLEPDEVRELARLLELRQRLAPAALRVQDVRGRDELTISLAYSPSFEARVLEDLRRAPEQSHVLLFGVESARAAEFHANFLIVQGALTYRPDPEHADELGFVAGGPGPIAAGEQRLGYLVIPARFDPAAELEIWWNDRSLVARLAP
ncbi:MAG: hypothetical protein ACE5FG_01795 [Myxococcota bacterium]